MSSAESRYAEALLSVAASPEIADKAGDVLKDFSAVMSNQEDLRHFLFNPIIPEAIKKDTVKKILSEDALPLFANFIFLLIDKGRLELLPDICEEYGRLKDLRQKNLDIHVYCAQPLEAYQLFEICEKYRKQYGSLTAEIHQHICPSLLGGLRIQIGDICIDDTLFGRLNGLLSALEV